MAIPAIKAALGEEGIVEDLDYRGVRVVSNIRAIPDSPWFMVTRMDTSEAYAPLKNRLFVLSIILSVLIIGIGFGFYLLWRLQRIQFYREKYEASKKLQKSESKYKALAESLNVITWEFDPVHDKWNYVAPQSLTILGYEPEEWKNFDWWAEHVYQEDREFAVNYCANETKKKKDHVFEYRFIKKDGSIIWVQESVNIQLENDIPVILRGIIMDITERKQVEAELILSRDILQNSVDCLYVYNPVTRRILKVNEMSCRALGYTREELLSMRIDDLDPAFPLDQWSAHVEQVKASREGLCFETKHKRKNGIQIPVEIVARYVSLGGNDCMVATTRDITQRKQAEEEIKKAKTEAERANRAKSEFLSGMSHELRTPMNSILGFAQLMNMGELKPAHKKGVDHILKSGKHLLSLINEVLELSRIEAGKISISLEPVQLNGVISEAMDIVRPLATQHDLAFNLSDSPGNDLLAKADKQRLRQVLLNLLSNAVKYNRDGGSVLVKCELGSQQAAVNNSQSAVDSRTEDRGPETEDRRPTVRISVTDTGNGIAPENIAKLFTPFERIGADKLKIEGSGIGLAVTRKLMEAMQGKIGVESEVGKGSTFWIELPQTESQLGHHKQFNSQIIPEQEKTLVNGTILYIEDNESNIQLVEQVLEAHRPGILLVTEMYGERTVKLACDYNPDLILLDLDLPDMHGSEVLKQIQANKQTKSIPVVVISADAMEKQIEKLLKAGAKDYLTKPLDVMEFLKVMDEYMSKK